MTEIALLASELSTRCADYLITSVVANNEITLTLKPASLVAVCRVLRDEPAFQFDMLMDVTAVDYLHFGLDDWQTQSTTRTGFGRGVTALNQRETEAPVERFFVVYHLLSIQHNHRVRLRVGLAPEQELLIDSVIDIWPAANWYEREVFDLFGIFFKGHPDLRRILTDYGFVGHPFRKDFPLIGRVEARYDAAQKAVVYEPVSITPRVLEPKVIRHDNRYADIPTATGGNNGNR